MLTLRKTKKAGGNLLEEIGRGDILAENSGYSSLEMDMRLSLKAELLSLYRLEERNLILKVSLLG